MPTALVACHTRAVRSWRLTAICLALIGICALAGPAVALASGPGSSAGDQQYVDPLAGVNGNSATHPTSTPPTSAPSSASSSSGSPSSGGAPSDTGVSSSVTPANPDPATVTATATATTATTTSAPTLPRTGFDVGVAAGLGLVLVGGGLGLRRQVARPPSPRR